MSLSDFSRYCLSAIRRRRLSWFGHICQHDTLPKTILQRTMYMTVVVAKVMEGLHQVVNKPVTVVTDAHCRWQKQMGNDRSRGASQSIPTTPRNHGNLVIYLVWSAVSVLDRILILIIVKFPLLLPRIEFVRNFCPQPSLLFSIFRDSDCIIATLSMRHWSAGLKTLILAFWPLIVNGKVDMIYITN